MTSRPIDRRHLLRAGGALSILAGLGVGLGLMLVATILALFGPAAAPVAHLFAAALLVLPMALAEFWSSALRAQGSVWTALVPRDIVWRVAAPLVVVGVTLAGAPVNGWQALAITA